MREESVIRIGFVGLGTVGQGVWKHLQRQGETLEGRIGARLEVVRAAVSNLKKKRAVDIPEEKLTDDPWQVVNDPDIDLVCELMGGTELARELTIAAIRNGKTIVTANKALICDHGEELFREAQEHGVEIYYEASVAGGIPIIKVLREGLVANRFPLIYGILNGTCNYILTRMEREQRGFDEILADARELGYVEADESLDLDGWDTAHKTAILSYLAHRRWISMDEMPVEGIRHVTLDDIRWARELGFRVKLLAVIQCDTRNDKVFASVHPSLIPLGLNLASVDGVYNAVSVHGDVAGESVYIGRGAGQDATASSVISDIVDAAVDRLHRFVSAPLPDEIPIPGLMALEDVRRPFYLRLNVKDKPGVLAEIATRMARHEISIASVLQMPSERPGYANLVLTTHETTERNMRDGMEDLRGTGSVSGEPFLMRIANFRN